MARRHLANPIEVIELHRGKTEPLRAVVVGAGIGGLATAISLRRAGHAVTVLEQAEALGEVGAGITVAPNASKSLIELGLEERLRPVATAQLELVRRRWEDGRLLGTAPLGSTVEARYGAPYWHIHRADLHKCLVDAATDPADPGAPVTLRLGEQVVDARPGGADEKATVVGRSGSGYPADLVIGADGIRSRIREVVAGRDDARYSGDVAYRGTVPMKEALAVPGMREVLQRPLLTNWLGPGRHLVHYHLRRSTLLNVLAVVPGESDIGESWTMPGRKEDLVRSFQGWDDRIIRLIELLPVTHRWALHDRQPLPTWVKGRIGLLGDACHAMLPYQAQGAAQAIEDALALGHVMCGVTADQVPAQLEHYQEIRLSRATDVQLNSRANGEEFHLPDGEAQLARDAALASGGGELATLDALWTRRVDDTSAA